MKSGGALAVEICSAATGRRRSGPGNPGLSDFCSHPLLVFSLPLPLLSFALLLLLPACNCLPSSVFALRFSETRACFKLYTPSICQPPNVRFAYS